MTTRLTRREFLATAARYGLALGAAAVFPEGASAASVTTLRFMTTPDQSPVHNAPPSGYSGQVFSPAYAKAFQRFLKAHPHVRVEVDSSEIVNDQTRTKLLAECAVGTQPDIAMIDSEWVAEFAEAGYLTPLDHILSPSILRDILPPWRKATTYKGKFYGIITGSAIWSLYYRKDIFERFGVAHPTDHWTWADLIDAALKLKEPLKKLNMWSFGFPAGNQEGTTLTWLGIFWGFGGHLLGPKGELLFDSPEGVKALQFYYDCVYKYGITPKDVVSTIQSVQEEQMMSGRFAMLLDGSYELPVYRKSRYGRDIEIAFYPSDNGRPHVAAAGGLAYAVLSKDPRKMPIIRAFLNTMVAPSVIGEYDDEENKFPPYASLYKTDPRLQKSPLTPLIRDVHFRPSSPYYPIISDQLIVAIQKVLLKQASPQEALQAAKENVRRKIATLS